MNLLFTGIILIAPRQGNARSMSPVTVVNDSNGEPPLTPENNHDSGSAR